MMKVLSFLLHLSLFLAEAHREQGIQWHSSPARSASHKQVSNTPGQAVRLWAGLSGTPATAPSPCKTACPYPGTPSPCALPPLPSQGTKACGRGSHAPPRAGPLGNLASEVSYFDFEQDKCRGLIFGTASSTSLSFLCFARKKFCPLPTLLYSEITRGPTAERQGSEEAAPGGPVPGGRWRTRASTALSLVGF